MKMLLPAAGTRNWFMVEGGPYTQRPRRLYGVKLADEVRASSNLEVPIRDFGVPTRQQIDAALRKLVPMILQGDSIYVGCLGGKGRTGLFLALLAKAFGLREPVAYVRYHFHSRAVETKEQESFVAGYEVPSDVRRAVRWARMKAWFRRPGNLTNLFC